MALYVNMGLLRVATTCGLSNEMIETHFDLRDCHENMLYIQKKTNWVGDKFIDIVRSLECFFCHL